ncbi:MAG: type IV toxin-antitoxin system AbiEi family antitoxin domain-containing protein [Elusimicrobiota bacterium]
MADSTPFKREEEIFRAHGGLLRTSQAMKLGIHPRDLYGMREAKLIEPLSRGLYRLASLPPLSMPDLAAVALRIPQGVICLISALAFHRLTTEIPHEVYVALRKGSRKPRLDFPPARFVWLSEADFKAGIGLHAADGTKVRVYCPEKTVADCFKFRNRIGLDVALEALRLWREKKRNPAVLLKYARLCRVERVMKPYLEALEGGYRGPKVKRIRQPAFGGASIVRDAMPVRLVPKGDETADLKYWLGKSPEERVSAVEFLREQYYAMAGYKSHPRLAHTIQLRSRQA